ncbi:MAG TPA: RNase adapter RapZ [Acidimicrobiales bacterium]|jgi:UPF0042 nucleotide-binding protein|nr:RNase adapter RapZ [Acidimicrobiales bacterium]
MTDFVVIAGLSGAGRTTAADELEDLGWFVIDNLPTALFPKFLELTANPKSGYERVALVVGAGPADGELNASIAAMRAPGSTVRILFLDASTESLVRRYESTRRRHPHQGGGSLTTSIEAERGLLGPLKDEADIVIDTSDLNIHELRRRVVEVFGQESPAGAMQVRVVSFGYKHGLPLDADLVFDCRFLPNPHWVDELRPLTGLDEPVRQFVLGQPAAEPFVGAVEKLLLLTLPAFRSEGKAYLTVAVGCTGGRHRSVAVAEDLGERLAADGTLLTVSHRDVDK